MKQCRLFVGNVPVHTLKEDLKQEFEAYGDVSDVEIKTKPDQSVFAFINIEADDRTVNQCIKEFSEQKFKGVFLNVSRAKESFLDRLKREREESQRKNPQRSEVETIAPDTSNSPSELPVFQATVDESESESSSSESEEEPEPPKFQAVTSKSPKPRDPDEFVKKWNCEGYLENGMLKIVSITGQVKEVIEMSKKKPQAPKKLEVADEKRLRGLDSIKNNYDNQKKLIQSALSKVDVRNNKKIVFEDSSIKDQSKKNLFEDDTEDVSSYKKDFTVKKQFQGEGGEELFQLQSKFQQDSRFQLDSRFADNEGNQKKIQKSKSKKSGLEKEKETQMKVLQEMGETSAHPEARANQKTMIRFDPTNTEHQKFRKRQEDFANQENQSSIEEFKVGDEKYTKIHSNLKDAFGSGGNEGFSILKMFGRDTVPERYSEDKANENFDAEATFSGKRFRYDSSDDEDNTKTTEPEPGKQNERLKKRPKVLQEKFFFSVDDARLKEGLRFFNCVTQHKNKEEVDEARKALKKVVKQKVKKQNIRQSSKEMYSKSFRKPVGNKFQKAKRKNFSKI